MNMPNASSLLCVQQCKAGELDDIEHALPRADIFLETLKSEILDLILECIKYLDFRSENLLVPNYLTAHRCNSGSPDRFCVQGTSLNNLFVLKRAF